MLVNWSHPDNRLHVLLRQRLHNTVLRRHRLHRRLAARNQLLRLAAVIRVPAHRRVVVIPHPERQRVVLTMAPRQLVAVRVVCPRRLAIHHRPVVNHRITAAAVALVVRVHILPEVVAVVPILQEEVVIPEEAAVAVVAVVLQRGANRSRVG